jgi:hypothetical protein
MAETLFKLLMKYRPEDKSAKKERLLKAAEAREAGERRGRVSGERATYFKHVPT